MAEMTFGLFLLCAVMAAVYGDCPASVKKAADCIDQVSFNKLSQGDPSYYCEEGSKLVAGAQNCLRDCSYNEADSFLQQQKNTINTFCAKIYPACTAVTDKFVEQTRCYDTYGGLDEVLDNIKKQFQAGGSIECNYLFWGRYCQKTQNCTFNQNLDEYLVQSNSDIALGLAICGSETLKLYLPYLEDTTKCNDANVDAVISRQCNISCGVANAPDADALCSLLENQAKCLEQHTAGCTNNARRYILPRLNTYAVANKHLGCKVQYNGIDVRTAGKDVDYIETINSCTFANIYPNVDIFGRLRSLFNRDLIVKDFCATVTSEDQELITCRNNFLAFATPQHRLLQRGEDNSIEKNAQCEPDIGAFPVDSFGMACLYKWLKVPCTGVLWSERICVAEADKPVITTVTSASRTTPPGKTPPPPASTGPHNGASSRSVEDFVRSTKGSAPSLPTKPALDPTYNTAGPMVKSAILLIIASLLSYLIL